MDEDFPMAPTDGGRMKFIYMALAAWGAYTDNNWLLWSSIFFLIGAPAIEKLSRVCDKYLEAK